MSTLYAIDKGVLNSEDSQAVQVLCILNDILAFQKDIFNPKTGEEFEEFVSRIGTSAHSSDELGNILKQQKSSELKQRLSIVSAGIYEVYKWIDITDQAYVHLIKKYWDAFREKYKVIIPFENEAQALIYL